MAHIPAIDRELDMRLSVVDDRYRREVSSTIEVLLLLALPASGKSELRRYLDSLDPGVARNDLRLGPMVQLDDYPYVHLMRRIDEELVRLGEPPAFFIALHQPFIDQRDWGTLIHLLNEDYARLGAPLPQPDSAGVWLLDRIDRARAKVGMEPATAKLHTSTRAALIEFMEGEAASFFADLSSALASWTEGSTVVIEFARGGPDGAEMPLAPPHGYGYSLGQLSDEIKKRASILYVWVTPEESRRKNAEREKPGPEGDASILFHGVPEDVMYKDYGTDDLMWLADQGRRDVIDLDEHEVPVAVFDNCVDCTSFLRDEKDDWQPGQVAVVHNKLKAALSRLGHA